jgi:hypothetical protein
MLTGEKTSDLDDHPRQLDAVSDGLLEVCSNSRVKVRMSGRTFAKAVVKCLFPFSTVASHRGPSCASIHERSFFQAM